MKKVLWISSVGIVLFALTLLIILINRNQKHDNFTESGQLFITVSIPPIKYLVERITGGDIAVNVILPPGSSPETYEPTPRALKELDSSPILYITGLIDFEKVVAERIATRSTVIELSHGIDLVGDHEHHHSEGHNHSHGVDPHIWSSPECLQLMAATIYSTLPQEIMTEKYRSNYDDLMWDTQELDQYIIDRVYENGVSSFLIYHPALTYYARDYGLEQLQLEYDSKEPSADKLRSTIERAKAEGLDKILYQKEFSIKAVETVAKEMGAVPVEIDPLDEDVLTNLKAITDIITSQGK